jgi:gamma-glutamyl:cysteine ligase YbdK (ATP-grasp superfamily)
MENISAEQSKALQQGYGGALSAAQADLTRQGELGTNIAQQYGSAGTQQLAQGNQLGSLAAQQQSLGITGAGALQAAGSAQQGQAQKNLDLAYQDFLRQQQYPQQQNTALIGALGGVKSAVPSAVA